MNIWKVFINIENFGRGWGIVRKIKKKKNNGLCLNIYYVMVIREYNIWKLIKDELDLFKRVYWILKLGENIWSYVYDFFFDVLVFKVFCMSIFV